MASAPDDPPDVRPEQSVRRAAALDDYLGGFGPPSEADEGVPADGPDTLASDDIAGLVDTMLLLRQAAAADGVVPRATPEDVPTTIGRYAILRLAGTGGFATVWEAFDTVLRRPVAVKVRRSEMLLSETARRRFVREAEIAARLVHPRIVTIFEVGEDRGREFIATEFCPGGSLAAWLERNPGPLPPRASARLVRAVAEAVAHAHAAGVVHRDIKPANVLLVPAPPGADPILPADGSKPSEAAGLTVKLGDFGLGKLQEDEENGDALTQLTRSGTSIGTPVWMAPEQIDRSFGPIGPATDVHGLGLLLDRLLTGKALRSGGTTAETYRQVLLEEAAPADRRARGIPRDLAAVCTACLAKDPAQRYPSAADLAADLDRWLNGRPTRVRPLSPAGQALRWIRRQPVIATLGAAAVVATLVASWAGVERAKAHRTALVQQAELRRQDAATELRRGFEALAAGNVAQAFAKLDATRAIDAALADSLAGRWLVRRAHGERSILLRPASPPAGGTAPRDLYSIVLSPDGRTAAVAGADGIVRLLRDLDATPTVTAVAAHDEINAVAFSPDGRRLATVGQDGLLRWWDVGESGLAAAGHTTPGAGPLYAVAFTPDGDGIVVGGEDRMVRLVKPGTPAAPALLFEFQSPPGKSPEIESITFVTDDTLAAACGDLIVLLDADTGRVVREMARPYEPNRNAVLGSITAAEDGTRLLACGTDKTAHIWDVATGRIVTSLPEHPSWVQGCCFVADGTRVATACRDGGLRVFDAQTGAMVSRHVGHEGRVWCVVAERTGTLLTCGADGTVRRWDPAVDFETAALRSIAAGRGAITRIAVGERAAGGDRAVVVSDFGGRLSRVDLTAGILHRIEQPGHVHAKHLAGDQSGRRLAVSWIQDRPVDVLELGAPSTAAASPVPVPVGLDPRQALLGWGATGVLVVCSERGDLCAVSWHPDRAVPMSPALEPPVHAIAVAPAGPPRVAAAGQTSAILRLPGPTAATDGSVVSCAVGEQTSAVAWSPDGTLVAFGTRTGHTLFFDAATGTARGTLVPHEREIIGMAFSRDGRIVVTADAESLRISDAATRTTLDEIRHGWHAKTLTLSSDDGAIFLGGSRSEASEQSDGRLAVMELDRP